jgi:hypothetical protein
METGKFPADLMCAESALSVTVAEVEGIEPPRAVTPDVCFQDSCLATRPDFQVNLRGADQI